MRGTASGGVGWCGHGAGDAQAGAVASQASTTLLTVAAKTLLLAEPTRDESAAQPPASRLGWPFACGPHRGTFIPRCANMQVDDVDVPARG